LSAGENNDKTSNGSQDASKDRIKLKKPMSAGRYGEVKQELWKSRTDLEDYSNKLHNLAAKYPDGHELKNILELLESTTKITGTGFTELYNLYRSNATLKLQVEALKEMILSIPEIRDNKAFQQKIQKEFTDRHLIWYDTEP
jgi:hypothetical protein